MNLFVILLLAMVQGVAELLPVSSSAHVIVTERLLGLDPSSPEMTFLLVMLHTGTMFAVLVYFKKRWSDGFLKNPAATKSTLITVGIATVATALVGYPLKLFIERVVLSGVEHAEIESLFSNLPLISAALFCSGVLILISARKESPGIANQPHSGELSPKSAFLIGAVQGVCLPFRGFSRSGATISSALLLDVRRNVAENFSFLLAVVLTPPVIAKELHRLLKARSTLDLMALIGPGLVGMCMSFVAGWFALRFLSNALENGRWKYFGYYCFVASGGVAWLAATS